MFFFHEKNKKSTDFWLDDMYLTNPLPLLINSNPFFLLPRQPFQLTSDLIRFASFITKFAFMFNEQIVRYVCGVIDEIQLI